MNDRFDRIAPGKLAKLNLTLDILLCVLILLYTCHLPEIGAVEAFVSLAALGASSWIVITVILRLYSPCTPRTRLDSLALQGIGVIGITVAIALACFTLQPAGLRFDMLQFAATLYPATAFSRLALEFFLTGRLEEPAKRVLVVGTGPLAAATYARAVQQRPQQLVVGFLRFPGEPNLVREADAPVLGDARDLLEILSIHAVNEVYIAGRVMSQGQHMQEAIRICEEVGTPFALPLHSFQFNRAGLLSSSPARDGYLHYLNTQSKPGQYAMKRLLDIAVSSLALVVLAPLMVGVALGIKLTSRGPVFFRQQRVGLHGAHFHLFKFRSMVVDAEALKAHLAAKNEQSGPVFKIKNDPRITRIGRFIRKYSIDELPQLINILRGDMSIVGPRPPLPSEVEKYKAWQRWRLSVRPGLTCYWQVGGRNEIGFEEWMRLDLRYVDNWSFAVDLRLILRTVPVVLGGEGAS